jgi:two-component system KDP operon response regulator KdpE
MARVLIIDDEPQIVSAVTRGLSGEGHDVSSALTGEDGLAEVAARLPDLVVLDLGLPDTDGIDVVRRLRTWSEVPVLILSAAGAEASKVDALDAGADDYLEKPFGLAELRARVRALLRRATARARTPSVVIGELSIDPVNRIVTRSGIEIRLTPKEWQLLDVLSAHPGKLLTHGWLIQQVWGRSHGDESRQTLRTHLRTLRAKLGDDAGAPRLVRTETGAGYRWLVKPEDAAS